MRKPQWHIVTSAEVAYSKECIDKLTAVAWARPLLTAIESQGGPSALSSRSLLFEVRFAFELYRSGITPTYEFSTGVGDSKVDFAIKTESGHWLIELVCADETDAIEAATYEEELLDHSGNSIGTNARFLELRSDAEDARLSEAGEMLKLQEKLYEKVLHDGQPHKFPLSANGVRHAIIMDARGFGGGDGPDNAHIRQLIYGPEHVGELWRRQCFKNKPVLGVFDQRNTRPGARGLQERIHIIGISNEREFGPGKFREQVSYCINMMLSDSKDVLEQFPLLKSTPTVN